MGRASNSGDNQGNLKRDKLPYLLMLGSRINCVKGGDHMADQTITLPVGGMTCANCAFKMPKLNSHNISNDFKDGAVC